MYYSTSFILDSWIFTGRIPIDYYRCVPGELPRKISPLTVPDERF